MATKRGDQNKQKIEDFAEELGRLLGTAQAKAENWLAQRKQVAKTMSNIRDAASPLLADLGAADRESPLPRRPRGQRKGDRIAERITPPTPKRRGHRRMSAAARKAASARMKKYWSGRRKTKGPGNS